MHTNIKALAHPLDSEIGHLVGDFLEVTTQPHRGAFVTRVLDGGSYSIVAEHFTPAVTSALRHHAAILEAAQKYIADGHSVANVLEMKFFFEAYRPATQS